MVQRIEYIFKGFPYSGDGEEVPPLAENLLNPHHQDKFHPADLLPHRISSLPLNNNFHVIAQ